MQTAMKPCGTEAAYLRHKRAGERPCDACLIAHREYSNRMQKERRLKDPERAREKDRRWRSLNADRAREQDRAQWHKLSPTEKYERRRKRSLMEYGLTPELVDRLLAAQNGCCAVCGNSEPGRKGWCIDHDHAVDKHAVRGLLCLTCNVILAMMGDDLDGVRRHQWLLGIRYLEEVAPLTATRLQFIKSNPAPDAGVGYATP